MTVTLTGASDAGPVATNLTVLAWSTTTLIVATPVDLFTRISGPATISVTTPAGTAQLAVAEFIVDSNGFGSDAGSDGFLGVVYKLVTDTPALPVTADALDINAPCASPSVIGPDAGGDAGVPCPFTSIEVPNLDVPPQHFTNGFPGLGSTLVEWFAIRFRGYLLVLNPGTYGFEACSDDGSNVYLVTPEDGGTVHQIIANDGLHGSMCVDSTLTLPVIGQYPMVVDYFQGPAPGIQLQLSWTPPGATLPEIIAPEALTAYVPE
ncbi:MAG: hypothetical protein JOZ69_08470 [Myxococcales bacterium]|nr:hypothetical protein [Myxococcales bacterium]